MSTKLPRDVSGRDVVKALEKIGYEGSILTDSAFTNSHRSGGSSASWREPFVRNLGIAFAKLHRNMGKRQNPVGQRDRIRDKSSQKIPEPLRLTPPKFAQKVGCEIGR